MNTCIVKLTHALRGCSMLLTRQMSESSGTIAPKFKPSDFQKKLLVWTKKYKTIEEVPSHVSADTMDRARSKARIKISNYLIALTALASLGAIFAGKAAAKRGESVHQQNLDWHKQYNEEYERKAAAAAAKNQ